MPALCDPRIRSGVDVDSAQDQGMARPLDKLAELSTKVQRA